MSFMNGCKPQGPLTVLTPEEQRVTDYYQDYTEVVEVVPGVVAGRREFLRKRERFYQLWDEYSLKAAQTTPRDRYKAS